MCLSDGPTSGMSARMLAWRANNLRIGLAAFAMACLKIGAKPLLQGAVSRAGRDPLKLAFVGEIQVFEGCQ